MERLFFIYMTGCQTCNEVKPLIKKFRDTHPNVKVIPIDITQVEWKAAKWTPEVTPTLVRLDRNKKYHVYAGRPSSDGGRIITPEEISTWLSTNF